MDEGKLLLAGLFTAVTELMEDLSTYEQINEPSVWAAREAGEQTIKIELEGEALLPTIIGAKAGAGRGKPL